MLAVAQVIYKHRKVEGITGPLYLGMDTRALSELALVTVLEVLAANGVEVMMDHSGAYNR